MRFDALEPGPRDTSRASRRIPEARRFRARLIIEVVLADDQRSKMKSQRAQMLAEFGD
jgi:hypothetical protein